MIKIINLFDDSTCTTVVFIHLHAFCKFQLCDMQFSENLGLWHTFRLIENMITLIIGASRQYELVRFHLPFRRNARCLLVMNLKRFHFKVFMYITLNSFCPQVWG